MVLSNAAKDRRACARKTSVGNAYSTAASAGGALLSMQRRGKAHTASVYRCAVCGEFHIGKPRR